MLVAQTNAPYPNRIQLVLGDWIGPLIQPSSPPVEFDPTNPEHLEVYVDGLPLIIQNVSFDSVNNRYLLFADKQFNLQGVVQVIHHMPDPPFQCGVPPVPPVVLSQSNYQFAPYISGDSCIVPAFSNPLTPGSIIVVGVLRGNKQFSSAVIVDTAENNYLDAGPGSQYYQPIVAYDNIQLLYALNSTNQGGNTISVSTPLWLGGGGITAFAVEFCLSGYHFIGLNDASPLGYAGCSQQISTSGGVDNFTTPLITTIQDGELVIGFIGPEGTVTSSGGFTAIGLSGIFEYKLQTSADSISALWSGTDGQSYAAICTAFKWAID